VSLLEPFAGTLLLPDKLLPHGDSSVELPDRSVVAKIRWNMFSVGSFDILDPHGQLVGRAQGEGFAKRRFTVLSAGDEPLLGLALGWRGTAGRSGVELPGGRELTVKGATFKRRFTLLDGEREIGAIEPTSGAFSLRQDAYAFELREPVLSIVQAVGLAQCLREAVKAARQAAQSRRR
jgi:hypothetical protein